jgi:ribosomal-protein-alanine N-acetyltransferase
MHIHLDQVVLRKPEPSDAAAMYRYRNNPDSTNYLAEHHRSFSMKDIEEWIERHRTMENEIVWTVADRQTNDCLGHAGLYQINQRVRCADAGIMLGDPATWGKHLGSAVLTAIVEFGFTQLNLNRVHGYIVAAHSRSLRMVERCGFKQEGVMRQAHYVDGQYMDLVMVGILRDELTNQDA